MAKLHPNYLEEEKPIIEFPAVVIMGIIFSSFCLVLTILFLPWHLSLFLFLGLCLAIVVFFNLYIGILIFLIAAFLHPTYWLPQLQAFHPSRLLAIAVFFIWGFHTVVYRDFKIIKAPQNFLIIVYMGLTFIASLRNFDFSITWPGRN